MWLDRNSGRDDGQRFAQAFAQAFPDATVGELREASAMALRMIEDRLAGTTEEMAEIRALLGERGL